MPKTTHKTTINQDNETGEESHAGGNRVIDVKVESNVFVCGGCDGKVRDELVS
jgi:hypothetical protein